MHFEDIEIPGNVSETIYVCVCLDSLYDWGIGEIEIGIDNKEEQYRDDENCTYKMLTSVDVDIDIPPLNQTEAKETVVESLECQKDKVLAEHHRTMGKLQEKIDSLLAIEYKPEG